MNGRAGTLPPKTERRAIERMSDEDIVVYVEEVVVANGPVNPGANIRRCTCLVPGQGP
jgi:hypothetical protein